VATDSTAINDGIAKLGAGVDGFAGTFRKRMQTVTGTGV